MHMRRIARRLLIVVLLISCGCTPIKDPAGRGIYLSDAGSERPALAAAIETYLARLERCREEGLEPEDYSYSPLMKEYRRGAAEPSASLERSFRAYVRSLAQGRIDPAWIGSGWERSDHGSTIDSAGTYASFLRGETIDYDSFGPQGERFRRLRRSLAEYRALAEKNGGWQELSPHPTNEELARRLSESGDLRADSSDAAVLKEALLRFQRRHSLEVDGVAGKATIAALNVPLDEPLEQIELNLERWRWLPQRLEDRYVEVNIPSYELTAYDSGRPAFRTKVIVGKDVRPTPVLGSNITAMEINPDWDVPKSIAAGEMLPILRRDPGYLEKNHLVVLDEDGRLTTPPASWAHVTRDDFPYRLRQVPGPWNSLGALKFVFQSRYGVYLHGTPARQLFARQSRHFSHGCIRIEDPLGLAEFAFAGSSKTREEIEAAMDSGESQTVRLPNLLPVYLTYWTAWVDEDGVVHFADDVYGGDAALKRELAEQRLQRTR